jgi:benzoyl-CoA reductase/2-hydroxyglutaryl-CoA dehydratase subunit BcrC/BadD/HgdB
MTPNRRRLTELDRLVETFKPDAVIDGVLRPCHGYGVDFFKVGRHIQDRHSLPFLSNVTDYSPSDVGQI